MIVFLKRLVGIESEQREVHARFKRGLNGFDERAEELEDVESKIAAVMKALEEKKEAMQASRRSGASGEHSLNLTMDGESCVTGEAAK
jgi:hypothetical protein